MTFTSRVSVAVLILLLTLGGVAAGAFDQAADVENAAKLDAARSEAAKDRALQKLRSLATSQTFRTLGFIDPAEVNATTLPSPGMATFDVSLDALRKFDAADPATLLFDIEHVSYQVVAAKRTVCLVTISRIDDAWRPVGFGEPEVAYKFDVARTAALAFTRAADALTLFIVRVPALNATFIGQRRGSELLLTAVNANVAGMTELQTLPAKAVFHRLKSIARRVGKYPT